MKIHKKYKNPLAVATKYKIGVIAGVLLFSIAVPFANIPRNEAYAQTSEKSTPEGYCAQYTTTSEKYACRDGWKGADCSDYIITHDQKHVDVCQDAARQAAEVGTTDTPTEEETPTTNNSNNGDGKDLLQDSIDKIQQTQKDNAGDDDSEDEEDNRKTDKELSEPEKPDNVYGQYVNGKNQYQSLRITKGSGEGARPAIVFINGGGWHSDDQMGDKAAGKVTERGYTAIVATYRLGSSGIYYMFEDVMRAMRHVRNNAAMYGIDPSRIAIWGDSAGGSLAMRAAGSGRSGAAAAVGWSAPTNAYTAIFKSPQSFAIGMDHSTCAPTDITGVLNAVDLLNGGEGDLEYDGGIGNNNFSSITNGDAEATVSDVLTLAERAQRNGILPSSLSGEAGQGSNSDSGSGGLIIGGTSGAGNSGSLGSGSSGGGSGGSGGDSTQNIRKLTSKKFLECLDNFNSASPGLFASPLTPPTFLAGFDSDPLVGPDQLYQMRDKLRGMGVPSSVVTLPGEPGPEVKPGKNHLDYSEDFVGPTLDFLDSFLHPN